MGQQFLIDTNSIIDYIGGNIPLSGKGFMNEAINMIPSVSIISKIEVLGFNAPEADLKILEDFFNDVFLLELSNQIVDKTISIRRTTKIKTPDAIIAATALVYDLTLITRNTHDFKNIPNLQLINPHNL